ncbi:PQQ-like beta-propeller repeat protein [Streptomyces sp. RB6PN25]|uniref:PQQ-like beta-propeller repeat protein n=1 Tax=Streptomyces humicola TaxID=2953240 RepID=A0ABT1PTR7_9ACTN|nr:PQQ-binding-like beta-propeller repeat protein [Streptomyces humicola]MCQ4080350.1 PQQ-like beta-propeller repeat protein [Streptomyces humicola]
MDPHRPDGSGSGSHESVPSRRVLVVAAIGGVSAAATAGVVSSLVRGSGPAAQSVAVNPSVPSTILPTTTRAPGIAPKPLWTYDKARLTGAPPVPVSESLVVVKGVDGLIGLDAGSGHHRWTTARNVLAEGAALPTGDGLVAGLARAAGHSRTPQAVDPSGHGRTCWTLAAPPSLHFPPGALLASDDTSLYVAATTADGEPLVLAYALATRRERWRAPGPGAGAAPLAVLDRARLVVCDGASLAAYDTRTGARQWLVRLPGAGYGRPVVDEVRAYVAGDAVTAVELASGRVAWSTPPERYGDPALLGGVAYAVGRASGLTALDALSGTVLWRRPASGPALLAADAPIAYRDRLYAITTDDRTPLAVFDTTSRRIAWTFRPAHRAAGTIRTASLGDRLYVQHGNAVYALPMD